LGILVNFLNSRIHGPLDNMALFQSSWQNTLARR